METAMKYMGAMMAALYVILGVVVLEGNSRLFSLPRTYSLIFGVVLVVYGIFRGYRIYQKHFRKEL
jgi:hypothetical protein